MPLNLDRVLLNKIQRSQTAPELVFDGDVDFGGISESSFDAQLIAAFKANTNIATVVLKYPASFRLIDKIMLALQHIKPPIELGLSELNLPACVQVMLGLPALKNMYALQLIKLSLVSCAAIMDRLPNSPQIGALELHNLYLGTVQTFAQDAVQFTQALKNLETVNGLRLYNLKKELIEKIMGILPETKIRMLRVIQPVNAAIEIICRELPRAKKMYAFDLVRVPTENCKNLMTALSKTKKIDVLGLTQLPPAACTEVMKHLPEQIALLFVVELSFEACEIIVEKLQSKIHVTEVRLVGLSVDAEVIMSSGLEFLGFVKSGNDPNIFINSARIAALPVPKTKRAKRSADEAGIADTSTSKTARSIEQQPSFPNMAKKIIASSAIFQNPAQIDLADIQDPEIIDASGEPPQRSREPSPNVF